MIKIDIAYEEQPEEKRRGHLGGSLIGHSCSRHIWYSFRWYKKEKFNGRMLRLFERGHLEEDRFAKGLRMAGYKVRGVKPDPQERFTILGHFSTEVDGFVETPSKTRSTKGTLEFKTYSHKNFLKLLGLTEKAYKEQRDKVEFVPDVKEKAPRHYSQCQAGMGKSGSNRCLYMAVNKNDDCLAVAWVMFDHDHFEHLKDKAEGIMYLEIPPPKNESWECNMCNFKDICLKGEQPEKNCRTCKNSKATREGGWVCSRFGKLETQDEEKFCYEK